MATYAQVSDVRAAASARQARRLPDDDGVESLLERGERAVDLLVGPWPRDPVSGLKFDPATATTLTDVQRNAVKRATVAWVIWAVTVGDELIVGGADYAPNLLVQTQRAASESPEMARALADHGLVRRTLTAGPDPEPVTLACPPDGSWCWS